LQLFQIILPADNDPMLSFEKPGHIHSLPVVEHTVVGLPPPFRKFVQGEFGTHQAEYSIALCTANVQRIITVINRIIQCVGYVLQLG
jgi:hypothetical protein